MRERLEPLATDLLVAVVVERARDREGPARPRAPDRAADLLAGGGQARPGCLDVVAQLRAVSTQGTLSQLLPACGHRHELRVSRVVVAITLGFAIYCE